MKTLKLLISSAITPKMAQLIEKLDEAGFICDGCLKFNEEQESTVKEIFEKFSVSDEEQ